MDESRYIELIRQLHAKTVAGEADWLATIRENEFVLQLNEASVSIRDTDFMSHVLFVIRNSDGRKIDNFSISSQDPNYQLAADLLDSARRRALRTDETLDSLLRELRGPGPIGRPQGKK